MMSAPCSLNLLCTPLGIRCYYSQQRVVNHPTCMPILQWPANNTRSYAMFGAVQILSYEVVYSFIGEIYCHWKGSSAESSMFTVTRYQKYHKHGRETKETYSGQSHPDNLCMHNPIKTYLVLYPYTFFFCERFQQGNASCT